MRQLYTAVATTKTRNLSKSIIYQFGFNSVKFPWKFCYFLHKFPKKNLVFHRSFQRLHYQCTYVEKLPLRISHRFPFAHLAFLYNFASTLHVLQDRNCRISRSGNWGKLKCPFSFCFRNWKSQIFTTFLSGEAFGIGTCPHSFP